MGRPGHLMGTARLPRRSSAPSGIGRMVKMHRLLLRIVLSAAALLVVAYLVSGVKVSLPAALGGAVVLGVLNGVLGPILRLLALPLTVMTLGLFSLVINAALFALGAWLVPGFEIHSFGAAFLGSI